MCTCAIWGMTAMNEWKRIISDRRRLSAMLCIPLFCLVLFFWQKCSGDFGTLLTDAAQYRSLVEAYSGSTPAEIIEDYADNQVFTSLDDRLLAQAEHLNGYGDYLDQVQEQARQLQATSIFGADQNSFTYRNILKTAADFAGCTAEHVQLGNDRALQDWLAFSLADWGLLAAVLLLVISFLDERKKGLAAIVRTCPAGRGHLQLSRLLILLLYSAGMTLLLYYLPLGLSMCIDGGWEDWSRPIQSLAEFGRCTVQMSIREFLIRYFLVKTLCAFLLGVLIWFALSFLARPQMVWLATAAGLVLEYLLYKLIPALSIFSPLREINVFSYVFAADLYTQYSNINFFGFPVGRREFLLGLLIFLAVGLSIATILVLTRRFPFGNRDALGKWIDHWNRGGDRMRKHLGLYGFEVYKFLFLSAGGLFLILGFLMTRNLICGTAAYLLEEDPIYSQYVQQVQGPITDDTYAYLESARAALDEASMDVSAYQFALDRLENTIANLPDGAWLVYEPLFLNCYGQDSIMSQRQNALLSYLFLVICLSALFVVDQNGDVRKILHSAPGGRRKLFWTKYAVALTVVLVVWLRVLCGEWRLSVNYMGEVIASAPCSSISLTRGLTGTINGALAKLYLFKLLALLIPAHFCIFIGERCRTFEKAFLLDSMLFVLPTAAYYFGGGALDFLTPASFLADHTPFFYGTESIPVFVMWMAASIAALLAAERNWHTPK